MKPVVVSRMFVMAGVLAWSVGIGVSIGEVAAPRLLAQSGGRIALTVSEPAGIRRTEYPVSTRVTLPQGAVRETGSLRLRAATTDVTAQFTPTASWDDGSIRTLDVDFNLSVGASESRGLQLEYGVSPAASDTPVRGGLTVSETADAIQVGAVSLGRRPWPLLTSIAYRGEIIGRGDNGLSLIDAAGTPHPFGASGDVRTEVTRRGPLLVTIRYSGTVTIDGDPIAVNLTCDLPNSKTWIKMTVTVDDRRHRVARLRVDTPFALATFPWTWDFGTDSGTYGAFRAESDRVVLTQRVTASTRGWTVDTGNATDLRTYERSAAGRSPVVAGWGHLLDARNAIAFAVDGFATTPGIYAWSFDGGGRARYEGPPHANGPAAVLYEHFVSTPVPIGAATSPTAMLKNLTVSTIGQ